MIKKSILLMSIALVLSLGACSGNGDKTDNKKSTVSNTTEQSVTMPEAKPASKQQSVNEEVDKVEVATPKEDKTVKSGIDHPVHLTKETFLKDVFDYEKNPQEWVYLGDKPCIIDFYADWCKPCKLVAPILDELARDYSGQVNVYKINTEKEKELAAVFGIRSIPSVLFCPMDGKPQMTQGALPKETFVQVINDFLLKNQNNQ